ncbi:MAG: hypothetical protein JO003_00725 [Candidatus Eremiobacteraeota bacterium]|nr:hypothetical protein [Candidatus Eremiobacteraeota bacterium]
MLIALAAVVAYASSPQTAAIGALYFDPKRAPVVRRVNVVGRYATVLTSGGRMEGELVTEAILVERFSFGWQPLDILNERCRLESQALGGRIDASLMAGMPGTHDDGPCRGYFKDSGPERDVESVRRLMRGPLVPYVLVAGEWAKGGWYGAGGGESLYEKRDGRWTLAISGGGAMGVDYMRKYGVPKAAWCKLGIFDARC